MIRFQRIGNRTYRVVRNYDRLGIVSEPTVGRGWRYTTATSLSSTEPDAIRGETRPGGGTRTEAVHALLRDLGISTSEYSPASRRGQARQTSPGTRGTGRAFGVELELTGPGASHIVAALRSRGINVLDHSSSYRATDGNSWELKHDGSVGGHGLELVSPKLRGAAGLTELRTVCEALNEAGATVNASCGLHVHHDMRNLSAESIKRQVLAFVERQDLIRQLVAPSRRTNHYCPEWTPAQAAQLRSFRVSVGSSLSQIAYIGPRGAINLQAYARHGSVEIRYHGGSTNFRKIAAWVRFGQALFAAAEAGAVIGTAAPEALMSSLFQYGLLAEDANTLLRFVRAARVAEEALENDGERVSS